MTRIKTFIRNSFIVQLGIFITAFLGLSTILMWNVNASEGEREQKTNLYMEDTYVRKDVCALEFKAMNDKLDLLIRLSKNRLISER